MLFRSGDTLSVIAQTGVAGSNGGLFSITSTGAVTFDPNGAFEALALGESDTTSLTYQITDNEGGTSSASITVTIAGANDAPNVAAAPANQTDDDGATISALNVPAIFADADTSDTLTYSVTGLPTGLSYNAGTGLITGTIDNAASQGGPLSDGVYQIAISANDGNGGVTAVNIIWTISNPGPTALANAYAAGEDDGSAVLGNALTDDTGAGIDSDPDGDTLSVIAQTGVTGSKIGRASCRERGCLYV